MKITSNATTISPESICNIIELLGKVEVEETIDVTMYVKSVTDEQTSSEDSDINTDNGETQDDDEDEFQFPVIQPIVQFIITISTFWEI
jgi:hypothetical protein